MTRLSVNINKVATLRNTRSVGVPSPVRAAEIALLAGADGITLHPRPDQRHIVPEDVEEVARLLRSWPEAEYNIEGNPRHGLMAHLEQARPDQATFVPDEPDALTSDHGWNLRGDTAHLAEAIAMARECGCRVSLFVDPDPATMARAAAIGADRVELYTEPYAATFRDEKQREELLQRYRKTALAAHEAGLGVNAGHDLNRENLGPFLRTVPHVDEVSIGHALIADAIVYGLRETVQRYCEIIEESTAEAGRGPDR